MRTVMLGVMAARLGVVMRGMRGVAVRRVGVMSRFLVIAALVVLGSLTVMMSSLLVVLGGLVVVFGSLMGHSSFLLMHCVLAGTLPCLAIMSRPHDKTVNTAVLQPCGPDSGNAAS